MIATLVTSRGYIYKVAVSSAFRGPHLAGRHIREFMAPAEAEKVMSWLRDSLRYGRPVRGRIELDVDIKERYKKRKIRIFPWAKDLILGYIIRKAP